MDVQCIVHRTDRHLSYKKKPYHKFLIDAQSCIKNLDFFSFFLKKVIAIIRSNLNYCISTEQYLHKISITNAVL